MHDTNRFFFGYQLREQSQPSDLFSRRLQFFFLELPRLQKKWEKLETNAERWCYLFRNLNNFASLPQDTAGFDDVFSLARTGELDEKALNKYVVSMLDEYTIYTTTEYARKEGVKEGVESVAKKMCEMKIPANTISEATGLSVKEIESLM